MSRAKFPRFRPPVSRECRYAPSACPIFRFTAILFMLSLGAGLDHELYHAKRPPDIAESYLAEAEHLYAAGDYALAVRRLRVAAELSRDDIAHYRLFEAREKLKTEQAP